MNATDCLLKAIEVMATEYPAGALSWATSNRPDLMREYSKVVTTVDEAYKSKDREGFSAAVSMYTKAGQRICQAYRDRGQAIQGELQTAV